MRRNVRERCTPAGTIFTSRRESGLRSGCRNIRTSSVGQCGFFFQPGEESSLGAWKVLETTALDSVTRVWGFHSDPTNLVNAIGIREGAVAAAVDRFVITITGVGCHGAHPDDGVDPIPAAAAMVQAFQTIVTRNINPFHPALISVTRLEAGNTWNVIPRDSTAGGNCSNHGSAGSLPV